MEALRFDPKTKKLSLETIPKPKIEAEDEIIVQVAYSGVCGTDLHIIEGQFPCRNEKYTPGHEFSGIVAAVGPKVNNVRVGDRVAIDPQNWCTTCKCCLTKRYHLCENGGVDAATGIGYNGGWAEYCKVRARQVYKLPANLSLKQGALAEPISCIVWGFQRSFDPTPVGSEILITGAGIIGNLWTAILHHRGHRKVTVVEPFQSRIEINKKQGTGYSCITPAELNLKLGKNWSADVAIDCSGNGKAIEGAIQALGNTGKLCIFGVSSPSTQISISPYEMYKKELTISASNINPYSMTEAIDLMDSMGPRYLDYNKLGIEEYKLGDFDKALKELRTSSIAKVVFSVNSNLDR